MIIKHKNKVISSNPKICKTYFSKLRGLMFRKKFKNFDSLIMINKKETKHNSAIHMFFVFYPISIIWLNNEHIIVDKKRFYPFHPLYVPKLKAKYILELPIEKGETLNIGDKINIET